MTLNDVPLFPLSAHILPGGKMSLRIFEARYTRMVKEACANQTQFCICMLNAKGDKDLNQHVFPLGTTVNVVDFDLLEDGLLGITVKGDKLVRINNIRTEKDQLRVGDVEEVCTSFVSEANVNKDSKLVTRLVELIDSYPEMSELYPDPEFDDPNWVVLRWLELLPIRAEEKQRLLSDSDKSVIPTYLEQLIK